MAPDPVSGVASDNVVQNNRRRVAAVHPDAVVPGDRVVGDRGRAVEAVDSPAHVVGDEVVRDRRGGAVRVDSTPALAAGRATADGEAIYAGSGSRTARHVQHSARAIRVKDRLVRPPVPLVSLGLSPSKPTVQRDLQGHVYGRLEVAIGRRRRRDPHLIAFRAGVEAGLHGLLRGGPAQAVVGIAAAGSHVNYCRECRRACDRESDHSQQQTRHRLAATSVHLSVSFSPAGRERECSVPPHVRRGALAGACGRLTRGARPNADEPVAGRV